MDTEPGQIGRVNSRMVVSTFFLYYLVAIIMKCIVGKKLGMTSIYDAKKGAQTLTMLECLPNVVSLIRTQERDGYISIQVSYPITLKKQGKKEFRIKGDNTLAMEIGSEISASIFSEGEKVIITGKTKGKGFQGVVKRHGFHGSDETHGHKDDHRAPGSIGSSFPEHVVKGKRMGGRMGGVQCTKRSFVEYVDVSKNIIGIRGAIPGSIGSIISIRSVE